MTVTVTSPALIGQRTAVSEIERPLSRHESAIGPYAVKFDLQGFQPFVRQNIVVTQGSTLTIDATLQVASLTESITVTGDSPVVDTTTTKVGATFSGEALGGVPSSTDLWGNLAQTPGVRMQGYDVGGSHIEGQQTGYERLRRPGPDQDHVRGIDTTEGDTGAFFLRRFLRGQRGVRSRPSAATSKRARRAPPTCRTSRAGGNRFSGLEHFTYEPTGKWMANNVDDATRARGFTGNPNLSFWETHVELGGPLVARQALVLWRVQTNSISSSASPASTRRSPPTSPT